VRAFSPPQVRSSGAIISPPVAGLNVTIHISPQENAQSLAGRILPMKKAQFSRGT